VPVDNDHDFSVTASQAGNGGAHVIAVTGQADLHTAPELRETIAEAIDNGARRVVIDLTDATFIDSMTLGVLLGALKRLSPLSGELAIVCPDHHLRRVFEITSLDRVLTLTDSRSAALEHLNVASSGMQ
jgi:anti-sigma B factor antagonist